MSTEFHEYLVFQIGDLLLGLPMDQVEEVVTQSPITPIPGTAGFVKGLAAVRGKIMSVIDGRMRLGLEQGNDQHFVICRVRGNHTAVTVERPIEAGTLCLQQITDKEMHALIAEQRKINPRLFLAGWRIFEKKNDEWVSTPRIFLEIISDQFVSDQMASQIVHA